MYKIKAFTLVELIITITILAILATIWFVSYSWYLSWVRDTNRISQLKSISDWLDLYSTKNPLPLPDDKIDIKIGTEVIAYQWYVWKNVLETIDYSSEWIDPKDWTYFSYYLTKDRKYFQLMAFLEDQDQLQIASISNKTFAAVDYSTRFPTVYWKKLWILITENNTPIQEIYNKEVDISDVSSTILKSYLKDWEYVEWQGTTFAILKNIAIVWWKYYVVANGLFSYSWPDWLLSYKDIWLCDLDDIHVPSLCTEWNAWCYVIAACNVWTTVATTIQTIYDKYFQWWNNAQLLTNTVTSNYQVDASSYWPDTKNWNYYSTVFIKWFNDWSSIQNDNLWWNTDNTSSARQWPCPSWYHIPSQIEWAWLVTAWDWTLWNIAWTTEWAEFISALKMPPSGYINNSAVINNYSYKGAYASSSPSTTKQSLLFIDTVSSINPSYTLERAYALSIRCLKN